MTGPMHFVVRVEETGRGSDHNPSLVGLTNQSMQRMVDGDVAEGGHNANASKK
jgi:hypothetical protein